MRKSWVYIAFINFLIAALLGLVLRGAFVWDFGFDYKNLLHTHSHIATLGWVYLILYALLVDCFVPSEKRKSPIYNRLFWVTQIAVLGMLFSFPFQGYGAVSITFSSMHIFASYYFARLLWRDMEIKNPQIQLLVKSSLITMVVSTIGIWAMGAVIGMGMQATPWYHIVVQFYLHFQFNGWFLMAVFALLLYVFNQWGIQFKTKAFNTFLKLYWLGLIATFAHVLAWAFKADFYNLINGVGVVAQLIGFGLLFKSNGKLTLGVISTKSKVIRILLAFGFGSLIFKVVLQTTLLIPEVASISTELRNFMIGYIHLTMLGVVSGFIFLILRQRIRKLISGIGIQLFILGFVLSEAILFIQGTLIWMKWGSITNYFLVLFMVSILLPLSLILLLRNGMRKSSE
jgi:hypothetical protein